MDSRSLSRQRRLGDRATEPQQQLITFQLNQIGFLLPIEAVHKAIVFTWVNRPVEQINFEGRLLPVLDVEQQIFKRQSSSSNDAPAQQQVALIIQSQQKQDWPDRKRVVLPIDSAPALCRIASDSFVPLPQTYSVGCAEFMTDKSAEQSLRFLLSPELLIAQPSSADRPPLPVEESGRAAISQAPSLSQ